MSHANARTTFQGRLLTVERHHARWPQSRMAKAMGLSRGCVKKWIDRYAENGVDGLHDRSSRPHSSPARTAAAVEQLIVATRRRERTGVDAISAEVGVPARTVSRVTARHGLPRLAELDSITGQVVKASKATAVRYERGRPGELLHMDVKKLGRVPDGGGWRATAGLRDRRPGVAGR